MSEKMTGRHPFDVELTYPNSAISEEVAARVENLRVYLTTDAMNAVQQFIEEIEADDDRIQHCSEQVDDPHKQHASALALDYRRKLSECVTSVVEEFVRIEQDHRRDKTTASHLVGREAHSQRERFRKLSEVERAKTLALLRGLASYGRLESVSGRIKGIGDTLSNASTLEENVSKTETQIRLLSEMISRKNAEDQEQAYAERAADHKGNEGLSVIFLVASAAVALAAIVTVWYSKPGASTTWGFASQLAKNATILGAATIMVRVALRTWQLERNLRIVYSHRVAALRQFQVFEATILKDNPAAKEGIRLELAKLLFADPQTGYGDAKSSDMSISPMVNLYDQASKRAGD